MSGGGTVPGSGLMTPIGAADSPSIDAFGRWRSSEPTTVFDSKNIFDNPDIPSNEENLPLFWDNAETAGSGTSTSLRINEAAQRISVGASTAGTRVRQTKQRFNYQPGKSQLIFITFNLRSLDADIDKNVGIFDEENGLFLNINGTDVQLCTRTFTSGSTVDNAVSQSDWNLDSLDGNGPSGITLDFTKTQILVIDYEWLGVGRVRMGFVIDGKFYYAHQFLNANNLEVVYMSTPNLPLRYEISNGGTGVASNIDCICSTVISEGGAQDTGIVRSFTTTSACNANAAGTLYAVLGIRLKSAYIGTTIKLLNLSLAETTGNDDIRWQLLFNPTVAGTFTYSDVTGAAVQTAVGDTPNTVTGGTEIASGFLSAAQQGGSLQSALNSALTLGSTISGTVDEIVLCVSPLPGSANVDVFGALNWRELS